MGTSFVTIDGEHGFWMRDSALELWLRLLSLHIEDPVESGVTATRIRDQWLLASRGYFNGCVPAAVDDAVSSEEGKALVIAAISSLLRALRKGPPTIDKDASNLLGFEGTWTTDLFAARLIEVGEAFLDLIAGKIQCTVSSTDFMPGANLAG